MLRQILLAYQGVLNFVSIYQANNIERILYDIDYMYQMAVSGLSRLAFRLGTKTIGIGGKNVKNEL